MYNTIEHQLVTIVTEAMLEKKLTQELDSLGVHGYTISDAKGRGDRGVRCSSRGINSNIRIEVICCVDIAEKIMKHIQKNYFDNYAIIVYKHQIDVVRESKF